MNNSPWWADQRFGSYNDTLDEGLSILDLVNSGTLDCKLAALLWIIMEHRASLLVASMPVYAGKTTLMRALLDFMPPDLRKITLKGHFEDFAFTHEGRPEKTCMITEEISNHGFYEYLWGIKAVRTFRLLSQGYALAGTMHARSSEEVLLILHRVLGIPVEQLAGLGIIVNLSATAGLDYDDDPIRRVTSVDLVLPHPEGLAIQVLAARRYTPDGVEKGFEYQPESSLQKALAAKHLVGEGCIFTQIEARTRFLKNLLHQGRTGRREVRNAVWSYRTQGMG